MIKEHCFGKDWFQTMSKKYKYKDLGIIEKVVRAYAVESNSKCKINEKKQKIAFSVYQS